MAGKLIANCTVCEKTFRYHKSKSGKFCSIPCYRVAQRAGEYARGPNETTHRAPCENCGKQVVKLPSKRRNGERSKAVFCNRACYDQYRAKVVSDRKATCKGCGAEFNYASRGDGDVQQFCTDDCRREYSKASPSKCVNCGCWFTALKWYSGRSGVTSVNGVKTCSKECDNAWRSNNEDRKRKISEAFTGKNHPNWQGGSHNINYRGAGWQAIRRKVRERARFKCEGCGMTEAQHLDTHNQTLHVNHKIPYHQHASGNPNRMSNLEALCVSCHMKADWKWRKENPTQLTLMGLL